MKRLTSLSQIKKGDEVYQGEESNNITNTFKVAAVGEEYCGISDGIKEITVKETELWKENLWVK